MSITMVLAMMTSNALLFWAIHRTSKWCRAISRESSYLKIQINCLQQEVENHKKWREKFEKENPRK